MKKTILLFIGLIFIGCQTNPNKVMTDFDWPEEKLPFFEVIHMQPKNHEIANFLKNILCEGRPRWGSARIGVSLIESGVVRLVGYLLIVV